MAKVKNLVAEISAASQEPLAGVGQINKTIISLGHNTQQNSSLVDGRASAGEELSGQAQELFAIVSRFKIGEGAGDVMKTKEKPRAFPAAPRRGPIGWPSPSPAPLKPTGRWKPSV